MAAGRQETRFSTKGFSPAFHRDHGTGSPLVKRKQKGHHVEKVAPPADGRGENVVDLTEALRRSLSGARRHGHAPSRHPAHRKTAPKRPTRKTAARRRA